MKKYDLKRLGMEAQEYQKDIDWLKKRLENEVGARQIGRINSDLRARQKRLDGILDKARNYGKGIEVFLLQVYIEGQGEVMIPYVDVEEKEIDLLLARDLKGLNYKLLRNIKRKTGEYSK